MEFSFIQADPSGLTSHAGGNSNVRKAAMRAFRRKERVERMKDFQKQLAMESGSKNKSATSSKHSAPASAPMTLSQSESPRGVPGSERICSQESTWSTQISLTTDIPPISPAKHCYSPSTAAPAPGPSYLIPSTGRLDLDAPVLAYLFNYFLSVMLPIMLPFNSKPEQKVVPSYGANSLLRDPLVLQIAVANTALYLDKTYKQQASVLSAIHVRHTISLINQRIEADSIHQEPVEAAIFSTNSNTPGDLNKSAVHMDAVRELVRMAESEGTLSSNNIKTVLSWSDNTSTRISRTLPRLACSFVESKELEFAEPFTEELSEAYKQETLNIIDELRVLTKSKERMEACPEVSIADIMTSNTIRNSLEKRLLCCQYAFYTQPSLRFEDRFLESCSIASSIYTALTFRNFRLDFPVLMTLKHDLIDSIKKAESSFNSMHPKPDAETPYAEMLFWVLVLGGIMSSNDDEKTWFVQRITMVLPWTLIRSWDEAEACLRRVMWTDKLCGGSCISLWYEVEVLAGLRNPL